MDRRTDYKTALLIEATIHDAVTGGPSPARALAALGIPFDTAMRVLTRPAQRRQIVTPPPKWS